MTRAIPILLALAAVEGQWSEAPGPITPEERSLLTVAEAGLARAGVSAVLTDRRFDALHPRPEFREAVRGRANTAPLTLVSVDEPGEPLTIACTIQDPAGAPVAGALVYLYQTSAKGWYAADGAHVRADSGDTNHARLFGYVRTDAEGRFELHTVRPGAYPRSTLPSHVHVSVEADGFAPRVTEFLFDDDPLLTAEQHQRAEPEGAVIGAPVRVPGGPSRVSYSLTLRRR